MKIHRIGIPALASAWLLTGVFFVSPSRAQIPTTFLVNIPGMTQPQSALAAAIDAACPRLAAVSASLNSLQRDLLGRCQDMETTAQLRLNLVGSGGGSDLGISASELADVMGKVSQEHTSTQGNGSVETASHQFRAIGARLAALRGGALPRVSLNGLRFSVDGKTVSAAQLLRLDEKGGGASADQGSRFGVFLNGVGSFGNRDGTDRQFGFDFHTAGVTAGADYRLTDNLVLGGAFRYLRTSAGLDNLLGDVDTNGYGGSLYGTYYIGAFHIDVMGGFTWNKYDTTRNIVYPSVNRTATGNTDGQEYTVDVGAGYDFRWGGFTLTPYGRLEYLNLAIDGYRESGALGLDLAILGQRVQSLRSALGLQLGYSISVPFGVLVPQVRAEWLHEYKNGGRAITAQFVNDPFGTAFVIPTDNPSRNFAAIAAGMSAVFPQGISAFVNYETFLGLTHVSNHQFTGGVRLEF